MASLETNLDFDSDKVLTIRTTGEKGVIWSYAKVSKKEGGFLSHLLFKDFFETIAKTKVGRVSAKQVQIQHDAINVDEIKLQAIVHYQNNAI